MIPHINHMEGVYEQVQEILSSSFAVMTVDCCSVFAVVLLVQKIVKRLSCSCYLRFCTVHFLLFSTILCCSFIQQSDEEK